MRVINRADADDSEVMSSQNKSSREKMMMRLSACSKDLTLLVFLDERTIDHSSYMQNALPVALK